MQNILFFDIEVNPSTNKIIEIGALLGEKEFHSQSRSGLKEFSQSARFICGHNIIEHDLSYLPKLPLSSNFFDDHQLLIDTLYLSTLLFAEKPYHQLVKDYYLVNHDFNHPLNDAKLAKKVFLDCLEKFQNLSDSHKNIYFNLLRKQMGFEGFFALNTSFAEMSPFELQAEIKDTLSNLMCMEVALLPWIQESPVELAYTVAHILVNQSDSILPRWVQLRFPSIGEMINQLKLNSCDNCAYCKNNLNPRKGLKEYFGYENFRQFDGRDLQAEVVQSTLKGESNLAIFPTGGGKSITFQLPAIMQGHAVSGLTVVISPLVSLMKDQVDVLKDRHDIGEVVALSSLLSPLERAEAIEKVVNGDIKLLYISPESLRSNTIFKLLKKRHIVRFVIDEAHCFSTWGQDFRIDYLFIGDFIRILSAQKGGRDIPISCFTATAKPSVIADICDYFKERLDLDLRVFKAPAKRTNLSFQVFHTPADQKYQKLKQLLDQRTGPKIVYVSFVKTAQKLVQKLKQDGMEAEAFYGDLNREDKQHVQNVFMSEEAEVIVATNAFGMGIDKSNVGMVIHYELPNSLENYTQEAGRAGRDQNIQADCFILFDEKDVARQLRLSRWTKLTHKDVTQIWRVIKSSKQPAMTRTIREFAKDAGWDVEEPGLETKVKAALSVLESCKYIQRQQNLPQIFADSFQIRDIVKANQVIGDSELLSDSDKLLAKRICQYLFSFSRHSTDIDSDVDWMIHRLDSPRDQTIRVVNLLREIGILGDAKDLTAVVYSGRHKKGSLKKLTGFQKIELALLEYFENQQEKIKDQPKPTKKQIYLKEIKAELQKQEIEVVLNDIRKVLNFWHESHFVQRQRKEFQTSLYTILFLKPLSELRHDVESRHQTSSAILDYLLQLNKEQTANSERELIEFSLLEIKNKMQDGGFFSKQYSLKEVAQVLLYLHKIDAIRLEDGLIVYYTKLKIKRLENNPRKQFTRDDYSAMEAFYQHKREQIHIMADYARRMIKHPTVGQQMVDDYFLMNFEDFLQKYFAKRKSEIRRPITRRKFSELFGDLSSEQLSIINDTDNDHILVAAGPGSGKTRILVHKLAALLLIEEVKPSQLLMLTFSRPAAQEFRHRLRGLVGNVAMYVDIYTYHSFAFHLLEKMGDEKEFKTIIPEATKALTDGHAPVRLKHKSVLVVDEYQDINQQEFELLQAIIEEAGDIRMVVVGDDDQNIYEFKGSSVKYMQSFTDKYHAQVYYLKKNYRSRSNLVHFFNQYVSCLSQRMKSEQELISHSPLYGHICHHIHASKHIIYPVIQDVSAQKLEGSTAILTWKNEHALMISTMLKQLEIPNQLILSMSDFPLKNLLELQRFHQYLIPRIHKEIGHIPDEVFETGKRLLKEHYQTSRNLELSLAIIEEFQNEHHHFFWSEWIAYLEQLRIEDYFFSTQESILVSTLHKAKGKEFDNVFLHLQDYPLINDENKRVLYVGMTRAKNHLVIHSNREQIQPPLGIKHYHSFKHQQNWNRPEVIALQLSLADIQLGHARSQKQEVVKNIQAGTELEVVRGKYPSLKVKGQKINIRFSKKFSEQFQKYERKGYQLTELEVGYIVNWFDKHDEKTYLIVLPSLVFKDSKAKSSQQPTMTQFSQLNAPIQQPDIQVDSWNDQDYKVLLQLMKQKRSISETSQMMNKSEDLIKKKRKVIQKMVRRKKLQKKLAQ